MNTPFHPAPVPLQAGGLAGAVEVTLPPHVDGAGTFSRGLGQRVALLFGAELMQRLAQRRAHATTEAACPTK